MKKEIIMAAAAAAASLVYLISMRKMRKALKEEQAETPDQRGHLTNIFSKAKKSFKSL